MLIMSSEIVFRMTVVNQSIPILFFVDNELQNELFRNYSSKDSSRTGHSSIVLRRHYYPSMLCCTTTAPPPSMIYTTAQNLYCYPPSLYLTHLPLPLLHYFTLM